MLKTRVLIHQDSEIFFTGFVLDSKRFKNTSRFVLLPLLTDEAKRSNAGGQRAATIKHGRLCTRYSEEAVVGV